MNLEALRALYEAMKAGTATLSDFRAVWPGSKYYDAAETKSAYRAARGNDMNAALALMPAVLPDALVSSMDQDSRRRWYVTLTDIRGKFLAHEGADTLARALTLAILAALIAIEEEKR